MAKETTTALSAHARAVIDASLKQYPADRRESAVLAALREVQHENHGYLTTALMDAVAAYLGMPPIAIYEVVSFYSMIETEPVVPESMIGVTTLVVAETVGVVTLVVAVNVVTVSAFVPL